MRKCAGSAAGDPALPPGGAPAPYVRIDPGLLEEATFLALRGCADLLPFDRERVRLYAIADPEERERRFRALHAAWFARLGLDAPLRHALGEQPSIPARTRACLVARAWRPRDEGADLHVADNPAERGAVTLVVRLQPESFAEPGRLLVLLRHELQHVADILDPRFGYEPGIPSDDSDPARRRLVLDRYAVLWDITVDGRLSRRGRAADGAEAARRREFESAFPVLGARAGEAFARFFAEEAPTHKALAAFARDPLRALERLLPAVAPAGRNDGRSALRAARETAASGSRAVREGPAPGAGHSGRHG